MQYFNELLLLFFIFNAYLFTSSTTWKISKRAQKGTENK